MKHIKLFIFLMIFQQIIFVQRISAQKIDFTEMKELSRYLGDGFKYENFSKNSGKYFVFRNELDSLYLNQEVYNSDNRKSYFQNSIQKSFKQDSSVFNKKRMVVYSCRKSEGKLIEEKLFHYDNKNRAISCSTISHPSLDTIIELYKYNNDKYLVEKQVTHNNRNISKIYQFGYKNGTLSYIINGLLPKDTLIRILIDTISARDAHYRTGFATQLRVTIIGDKIKNKLITRQDSAIAAIQINEPVNFYMYYLRYDQLGKLINLVGCRQIPIFNGRNDDEPDKYYKYSGMDINGILTINSNVFGLTFEIEHFTFASNGQLKSSSRDKYSLNYERGVIRYNIHNEKLDNDSTKQKEILNLLTRTLNTFGVVKNLDRFEKVMLEEKQVNNYSYK